MCTAGLVGLFEITDQQVREWLFDLKALRSELSRWDGNKSLRFIDEERKACQQSSHLPTLVRGASLRPTLGDRWVGFH